MPRGPGSSIGWGLAGSDDRYYSITAIVDTVSMAMDALAAATVREDFPDTPAPVRCETRGPNLVCARIDSPSKTTLSVYRNGIRLDVTESPHINAPAEIANTPVDHDAALERLASVANGLRPG